MTSILRHRVLLLLLLCTALCRAENVTHRFHEMGAAIIPPSNKIAITPLATYTCTGGENTKFGVDVSNKTYISINLPDANNFVTTSAIENLSGIAIWHYPLTTCNNIILQLSRDSVHWTEAIIQAGMYSSQRIAADFVPGRYYVRIKNTTGDDVSLWKIIYSFGSGCNCVLYIPE